MNPWPEWPLSERTGGVTSLTETFWRDRFYARHLALATEHPAVPYSIVGALHSHPAFPNPWPSGWQDEGVPGEIYIPSYAKQLVAGVHVAAIFNLIAASTGATLEVRPVITVPGAEGTAGDADPAVLIFTGPGGSPPPQPVDYYLHAAWPHRDFSIPPAWLDRVALVQWQWRVEEDLVPVALSSFQFWTGNGTVAAAQRGSWYWSEGHEVVPVVYP